MAELAGTSLFSDGSLVAYYKLENVNDSKGSATLSNTNSVTFGAAKYNNGADFGSSNTNKTLSTTLITKPTYNGNWSIVFWANFYNVETTGKYFMSWGDGNNGGDFVLQLEVGNTSGKLTAHISKLGFGENTITDSTSYSASTWYHFALTYANGAAILYRNGIQVGTVSYTQGSAAGGNNTLDMGARFNTSGGSTDFTSLKLDDWAYFTRVLSQPEVAVLYSTLYTTSTTETATMTENSVVRKVKVASALETVTMTETTELLAPRTSWKADTKHSTTWHDQNKS